jgi:putative transposase
MDRAHRRCQVLAVPDERDQKRGTQDLFIAVVNGLKGVPAAITVVFPNAVVQTCVVHLICYLMQFASWKAVRHVYRASNADAAAVTLDE